MEEEGSRERWRGSLRAEGGCLSLLSAAVTTFQTRYYVMNTQKAGKPSIGKLPLVSAFHWAVPW